MAAVYLIYARMENADEAQRPLVPAVARSTCGPHQSGMNQSSIAGQPAERIASFHSVPAKRSGNLLCAYMPAQSALFAVSAVICPGPLHEPA